MNAGGNRLQSFSLIQRIRRSVADARHVGENFPAAPLGHDAHEQFVAPALHDFDFDAREFFFELAQKTKLADRVVGNFAFLLRRFDRALPFGFPCGCSMNGLTNSEE